LACGETQPLHSCYSSRGTAATSCSSTAAAASRAASVEGVCCYSSCSTRQPQTAPFDSVAFTTAASRAASVEGVCCYSSCSTRQPQTAPFERRRMSRQFDSVAFTTAASRAASGGECLEAQEAQEAPRVAL